MKVNHDSRAIGDGATAGGATGDRATGDRATGDGRRATNTPRLAFVGVLHREGRLLRPPVEALVARLRSVPAPDRILAAGLLGWQSIEANLRPSSMLPRSGCTLVRRWARAGFRRSARPGLLDRLAAGLERPGFGVFDRAERRLLQPGAKSRAARAFTSDVLVTTLTGGVVSVR